MSSITTLPISRTFSSLPRLLLTQWKTWRCAWEPSLFFQAPYALPAAKLRKQRLLITRLFWLHTGLCAVAFVMSWLYP